MIGSAKRDARIRALEEEVAALRTSLATVVAQGEALSARLTADADQVKAMGVEQTRAGQRVAELAAELAEARMAQGASARLEQRNAVLAATVAEQAQAVAALTAEVAAVRDGQSARDEQAGQLRADLARHVRQTAIDLDEMRTTNLALAQALATARPPSTAEADRAEGGLSGLG